MAIPFFSGLFLLLSLYLSILLVLSGNKNHLSNRTSALDDATLAPNDLNTSFLAATGSVAVMADTVTTPRATKPRARASAICPAPMKPTRLLRDIVGLVERGKEEKLLFRCFLAALFVSMKEKK